MLLVVAADAVSIATVGGAAPLPILRVAGVEERPLAVGVGADTDAAAGRHEQVEEVEREPPGGGVVVQLADLPPVVLLAVGTLLADKMTVGQRLPNQGLDQRYRFRRRWHEGIGDHGAQFS